MEIEASLKVGDPAPNLHTGKWMQGGPIKQFEKGKAYLVEFWATWCAPCRATIPHLNELHAKYGTRGLTVIGQDCWEQDESKVAPFVRAMGEKMIYPVALDNKLGNEKGEMADQWLAAAGQDGIPAAFLVDKNGSIAWIGHPMTLKEDVIEEILAEKFDLSKAKAEYAQKQKAKAGLDQAMPLVHYGMLTQAEQPSDEVLTLGNPAGTEALDALAMRADLRARKAQWQSAAVDLARVVQGNPSNHYAWYKLAPVLILAGDIPAYQKECQDMLARFGESDNPIIAERAAKACLLLPSAVNTKELVTASKSAAQAAETGKHSQWLHWFEFTRGLALYRQADFVGASEWMKRIQNHIGSARDSARHSCEADSYFVLAMAAQQTNERQQARAALQRGLQIVQSKLPRLDGSDLGETRLDVSMTHILMREAKELIEGDSTTHDEKR